MITGDETRDILDTGFYIYDGLKGVTFGVMLPRGVITSGPVSKSDYIDWLRSELEKCHFAKVPAIFEEI